MMMDYGPGVMRLAQGKWVGGQKTHVHAGVLYFQSYWKYLVFDGTANHHFLRQNEC